jgi:hypothetical protein
MTPPSTRTRVIGHPIVAGTMLLAGTLAGIAGWCSGEDGGHNFAILMLFPMAAVMKGAERVSAYKRWKAEWDGMSEPDSKPRPRGLRRAFEWLAAGAILLLLLGAAGGQKTCIGLAVLLVSAFLATMLIRGIARRLFRRRHGSKAEYVRIVAKPIIPTPSLAEAYARLPAHCQRVMKGAPA